MEGGAGSKEKPWFRLGYDSCGVGASLRGSGSRGGHHYQDDPNRDRSALFHCGLK